MSSEVGGDQALGALTEKSPKCQDAVTDTFLDSVTRPGEISSEVGGDQALGALTKKGPKRQKGPQSVCNNSKLPKKQQNVSAKRAHFKKYRIPSVPPKR